MTRETLACIVQRIAKTIPLKRLILVHEGELALWNLDYNIVPLAFDFVVADGASTSLLLKVGGWKKVSPSEGCIYHEKMVLGWTVRLWTRLDGMTIRKIPCIPSPIAGIECVDPHVVLESLGSSPDREFLYEERAAPAAVLYCDQMSDEELCEFARYVRLI